jgi:uncharacterized protein
MARYGWNQRKNCANRRKHGVSFEAAALVFRDPHVIFVQDREVDGEPRWQAIGRAREAALLLVAHAYEHEEESDEERIRIISARKATIREEEAYYAQFHAGR